MKRWIGFILTVLVAGSLFGASVNVDDLKIISDSYFDTTNDGVKDVTRFQMNTFFKFVTSFDGGYKFAAKVAFETSLLRLEQNYQYNQLGLGLVYMFFRSAEVTAKNLADSHLDISLWTGTYRFLGENRNYKGYLYYPLSPELSYDGFYRLRGTGITMGLKFWEEHFKADLHLYQNTNMITVDPDLLNVFSVDASVGLEFKNIQFNIFGGYTKDIIYPVEDSTPDLIYGRGKAGLTFWVGNDYVDFTSTFGLPSIDRNIQQISFNSFYLMGELHFKLGISDTTITFLTLPLVYNDLTKDQRGETYDLDVNLKINLTIPNAPITTGLMANLKYSMTAAYPNNASIAVSPYFTISMSGVMWGLNIHYDFAEIMRGTPLDGLRILFSASSRF